MEEVYILIRTLVVARRASRDVGSLRAGKEARKEEEMKRKVRRDGAGGSTLSCTIYGGP